MPFKSKAQMRACYAKDDPDWDCEKWESHTPNKKSLPKRKKSAQGMIPYSSSAPKAPGGALSKAVGSGTPQALGSAAAGGSKWRTVLNALKSRKGLAGLAAGGAAAGGGYLAHKALSGGEQLAPVLKAPTVPKPQASGLAARWKALPPAAKAMIGIGGGGALLYALMNMMRSDEDKEGTDLASEKRAFARSVVSDYLCHVANQLPMKKRASIYDLCSRLAKGSTIDKAMEAVYPDKSAEDRSEIIFKIAKSAAERFNKQAMMTSTPMTFTGSPSAGMDWMNQNAITSAGSPM